MRSYQSWRMTQLSFWFESLVGFGLMYTPNPGLHPEWLSGVRLMRWASQVLTITAHWAGREKVRATIYMKPMWPFIDGEFGIPSTGRPLGNSQRHLGGEAPALTSQSQSIHGRPRRELGGVVQIGMHSSQSPRLPALMDVSLVWKDNEIEGGEDFGLPWRIWTRAKNTNRPNPSVLLCVLRMFWIRQQPLLSAEKQISLPSIVSQWPWCVSPLPSVQGMQLLFIRLPLHIVWPLLKLPCLIFFPPTKCKGASVNLKDDWMQMLRILTEACLPRWRGAINQMLFQSALNAKTLAYLRSECYLHIVEHIFFLSAVEFRTWICLTPCLPVFFFPYRLFFFAPLRLYLYTHDSLRF